MSFLSDIFSSSRKGEGYNIIPSTSEQNEARKKLLNLASQKVTIPAMEVPGLSDYEKQGLEQLKTYLNTGTPTGVTTGINELTKTVEGGYDPFTSSTYQGYRKQSLLEEEEAVNELRRRLQLVGHGGLSTPALNEEGKTRRGYSADRMAYLGQLYDQERSRQFNAAPTLIEASRTESETPLRKAAVAEEYGGLPREIATAQEEAQYNALIQTLLFPYTTQADLLGMILGETRAMYDPGVTSPSVFSQLAGAATVAAIAAG